MPLPQEDVSCEWMVMHGCRCGDFPGEGDLPAKMEMVEGRVGVGAQGQSPRPQAQLQPMRPGPGWPIPIPGPQYSELLSR